MTDVGTKKAGSMEPQKTDNEPDTLDVSPTRRTDVEVGEIVDDEKTKQQEGYQGVDMFSPFPHDDLLPDEPRQLSPRAVVTGWLLGSLVHASNVYLGLKAGIANDANMFATLLGFVALMAFQKMAIPMFRGSFGPREHNIIQTVATSTGTMSVMFFGAVPAMYQLGLLDNPRGDFGRLAALTGSAAFFGSAMSVPLRRIFILHFGRELDLVFPAAAAIATAIRQLHLGAKNPDLRKSTVALVSSFSVSTVWTIGASYARGILWDWNITWYIYQWGGYANRSIYAVNWGFFTIEWTPALIGIGMLIPLNVAASWLLGYCVCYGIIGPILVAKGMAVGVAYNPDFPDLVTYKALASPDLIEAPSPRYWLLFPAIIVTVCATFTDVLVHYKMFWNLFRVGMSRMAGILNQAQTRLGWSAEGPWLEARARRAATAEHVADPSPAHELVKSWEWFGLSLVGLVISSVIMTLLYEMHYGIVLLSIAVGMLFAIVTVVVTGQAGVTPGSVVSSASQLALGGALQSTSGSLDAKLLSNLAGGAVSGSIAQQSTELTTDFKIGFFLGTSPRAQWFGQLLGCLPAMFLGPALFLVFAQAYPCIIDVELAATCQFATPSVQSYRVIATAMLNPVFPVARSSWIFAIVASVTAVAIHLLRHWLAVTGRTTLRSWTPNMLMVSMGALIPVFEYGLALTMGATASLLWKRYGAKSFGVLMIPVAAGMIAGESIGGILNAILTLGNVGPSTYGSNIGCVGNAC